MSTDTDDEGAPTAPESHRSEEEEDEYDDSNKPDEANDDEENDGESGAPVSTLLITANVGSIFEDPDRLIPIWQGEVIGLVAEEQPQFVAIHFQEVGGKNVQEGMLQIVQEFVETLISAAGSLGFSKHCVFFDQNYQSSEKFTALGSLYLVHSSVAANVEIYNFQSKSYHPLTDSIFHLGSLDHPDLVFAEKHKFPLHFFPDSRPSRKGFIRARFRLRDTLLELLNIHLFHDACNLVSCEAAPSIYCEYRRKALQYTLDRIGHDAHGQVPTFVFGDFNFRLEGRSVLTQLSTGLSRDEAGPAGTAGELMLFRDLQRDQVVLAIGKKEFTLENHEEAFSRSWSQWTAFDLETSHVDERLAEWPINFPPTYPFEEDPSLGSKYMRTRCPAWCDRILFSHSVRQLMRDDAEVSYDVVGREVCMGDHKPVFLRFGLKGNMDNAADYAKQGQEEVEEAANKCPRVESPTYTDLLSNSNIPCTRYIEMNDMSHVKLFKETTV